MWNKNERIFNIIFWFMPLTGGQEAAARLQSKSLLSNESLSPPYLVVMDHRRFFFLIYRTYVFGHTDEKKKIKIGGCVVAVEKSSYSSA